MRSRFSTAVITIAAILVYASPGLSAAPLKIGGIQELNAFGPIVAEVFTQAGFDVEIVWIPTIRLASELKSDNIDGAFFFTDLALQTMPAVRKVPVPLYQNDYIAISANPSVTIHSIADLAKWRVAYVRGNAPAEQIVKNLPPAQLQDLTDATQLFKMLGAGRVDAVVTTKGAMDIFGQLAEVKLYPQEPALLMLPLFLAMSPRMDPFIPRITAAFDKAVKSGAWAKKVRQVFESLGPTQSPAR